jgi:hypothetical protein
MWVPLASVSALLEVGANPNLGPNPLTGPLTSHRDDPRLLRLVNLLLDNRMDPDIDATWLSLLRLCSGGGARTGTQWSKVLTSFASHGAHFSLYRDFSHASGNMFHLMAGWAGTSAAIDTITGGPNYEVCKYDWSVFGDVTQLLDERDANGNRPIDLIGYTKYPPVAVTCQHYSNWRREYHPVDPRYFDRWTQFYLRLGSKRADPVSRTRICERY